MPFRAAYHPSSGELIAFAQGSLGDPAAMAVEAHMALCEQCATVVANAPVDRFIEQLRTAERSSVAGQISGSALPKTSGVRAAGETIDWQADDKLKDLPPDLRNHPRLEFRRRLATGAMGTVYAATDRKSGKQLAVKVLNQKWKSDGRQKRRFLDEARLAMRLRHPNIAEIFDLEPFGQSVFFTMELISGETLADMVVRRGPLPIDMACQYVRQTAAGLQFAHENRVIHRDIKPNNLMIDSGSGQVKILDFGLGRLTDEHRTGTRLTKEGEILGTLGYLSPEQAANSRQTDIRSDIYSLGCTFFFLLTGLPPFRARNAVELLNKHLSETPPSIQSLRPDVPAGIAALHDRMLAKDPRKRPQMPRDVAEGLIDAVAARCTGAPLGGEGPTRRGETAGAKRDRSARVRAAFSPAVVLPLLTLLACAIWLLVSKF